VVALPRRVQELCTRKIDQFSDGSTHVSNSCCHCHLPSVSPTLNFLPSAQAA
jgi:hypothetical protein